jgi:N-acetylglucosaminyl-diphospho-decaprenol L-rhamnosyltransferase
MKPSTTIQEPNEHAGARVSPTAPRSSAGGHVADVAGTTAVTASVADLPQADVCVIVVSFNSADHLPELLDSLAPAADGVSLRVVVVDNASDDDSVAVARRRGATVVETGANLGYAAGINYGRPWAAGCSAILIANPDLRFADGAIRTMFDSAMKSDAVVVPTLTDADGRVRPSLRREPTLLRQLGEALLGDHWPGRPASLAIMVRTEQPYGSASAVDWATGAALMIPSSCDAAVGPWEEAYFLYSEEVDFARQAREHGRHIWFIPDASAAHTEGGSGQSQRLYALDAVNRIRYFSTWNSRWRSVLYGAAVAVELVLRAGRPTHRGALRDVASATLRVARGQALPDGREVMGLPARC